MLLTVSVVILALAVIQPPSSLSSRRYSALSQGKPVPLQDSSQPPNLINPAALSGVHLVQSPNIFRGVSPSGELLEKLPRLGPDEELEVRSAPPRPWPHAASQQLRRFTVTFRYSSFSGRGSSSLRLTRDAILMQLAAWGPERLGTRFRRRAPCTSGCARPPQSELRGPFQLLPPLLAIGLL